MGGHSLSSGFDKMRPLPWIILLIGITLVQGERSSLDKKENVSKLPEQEAGKAEEIEKISEKKQKPLEPQRPNPNRPSVINGNDQRKGSNSEIDRIKGKKQKPSKPRRSKPNSSSSRNKNAPRKPPSAGDPRKRELQNRSKQERNLLL